MNAELVFSRIADLEGTGQLSAKSCIAFIKAVLDRIERLPEIARMALGAGTKYWNGQLDEETLSRTRAELQKRVDKATREEGAALRAMLCYVTPNELARDPGNLLDFFISYVEVVQPGFDYAAAFNLGFENANDFLGR
jgi:hypothetical protein